MPEPELLVIEDVSTRLSKVGAPWMLTGSMASNYHGVSRSTHDVDVVIELPSRSIKHFIEVFGDTTFRMDAQLVRDSALAGTLFQLTHETTGIRIDFWPLKDTPFDGLGFDRREEVDYVGVRVPIISAGHLILQKLRWASELGGSEKQFNDAKGIYELRARQLDMPHMDHWALMIGVKAHWERLKAESDPL